MRGSVSPYDYRTLTTRTGLSGDMTCYKPNLVYRAVNGGLMYYINQRGYYHLLSPRCVKFDYGNIREYWTVEDALLTPNDTLTRSAYWGYFNTQADCIAFMETEMLNKVIRGR